MSRTKTAQSRKLRRSKYDEVNDPSFFKIPNAPENLVKSILRKPEANHRP